MMRRQPARTLPLASLPIALLAFTACDDTFVPIEREAVFYSIHGYLDASADTQWIRVMPVRDLEMTDSTPLDAIVFLEEVESGKRIEMVDSIFHFPAANPDVDGEGIYVHNFWTSEPILPGATYRFSATVKGGPTAEATISIPDGFDITVQTDDRASRPGPRYGFPRRIFVEGSPLIAFVGMIAWVQDECGEGWAYRPFRRRQEPSERHDILMQHIYDRPFRPGCGSARVISEKIIVFGADDPWPWSETPWMSAGADAPERPAVSDIASNVTFALGFIGGTMSRRVPYEECIYLGWAAPPTCDLHYDETTASLSGRVIEQSCRGGPVSGASVVLEELGEAEFRRRRSTESRGGEYLIMAIEGNRRYALEYTAPTFRTHTDTIELAVGERLELDLYLIRTLCP